MPTRKDHRHGYNLAVARALTKARLDAGYTVEDLAAALDGISLSTVQRHLTGKSAIDVDILNRICSVLGVSRASVLAQAEVEMDDIEVDRAVEKIMATRAQVEAAVADVSKESRGPRAG